MAVLHVCKECLLDSVDQTEFDELIDNLQKWIVHRWGNKIHLTDPVACYHRARYRFPATSHYVIHLNLLHYLMGVRVQVLI